MDIHGRIRALEIRLSTEKIKLAGLTKAIRISKTQSTNSQIIQCTYNIEALTTAIEYHQEKILIRHALTLIKD